jgi:tryptophanase
MSKEIYSPVYGCTVFDDRHEDDNRKVIDYETLLSLSKSLKTQQLKLLHKHIIDIADELYRFSDELDMSDKEECSCKISIFEAIKELNNVTEYLTKQTLGDADETSK